MKIQWVHKLRDTENNNQRSFCSHFLLIMCLMLGWRKHAAIRARISRPCWVHRRILSGIKGEWPKTKGQDPKMIKACMKISRLDVFVLYLWSGTPESSMGKGSLPEPHKWRSNLWNNTAIFPSLWLRSAGIGRYQSLRFGKYFSVPKRNVQKLSRMHDPPADKG